MAKKWYQSNKKLYAEEEQSLRAKHPFLKLEIIPPGSVLNKKVSLLAEAAVVNGICRLTMSNSTQRYWDYRIAFVLPDNYPATPPIMYCNDDKLPIGEIDRHIMNDGQACLGVQGEVSQRWKTNPRILAFLDDLVAPFLVWQVYYDENGHPPLWGQRSHGLLGILEFYGEILSIPPGPMVVSFMKLLARKNRPQGHEECPCGSGQRLRHCHAELIKKGREVVDWQDVSIDLSTIEKITNKAGKKNLS
jgi:hypothetical protein